MVGGLELLSNKEVVQQCVKIELNFDSIKNSSLVVIQSIYSKQEINVEKRGKGAIDLGDQEIREIRKKSCRF